MKNLSNSPVPQHIYVGKLRRAYHLSIDDAETMLNEIGGIYSSRTHNIHRGEEYRKEKSINFIQSLSYEKLVYSDILFSPASIVNEAKGMYYDKIYNPITVTQYVMDVNILRYLLHCCIIDTCKVLVCDAVLYIEEELARSLINELPELTHTFCKELRQATSRKGSVPAALCLKYEKLIEQLGEKTSKGRYVRAYLRAMQGVLSNKEIAAELGYNSSENIRRCIEKGKNIAEEHSLPSLAPYEPQKRKSRRGPKKSKAVCAG